MKHFLFLIVISVLVSPGKSFSVTFSLLFMQLLCLASWKTCQILDFQWLGSAVKAVSHQLAQQKNYSIKKYKYIFYSFYFFPQRQGISRKFTEEWKRALKRFLKVLNKRKSYLWKVTMEEKTVASKVQKY